MPRVELSDATVRNLTSDKRQTDYWDQIQKGLCCRVSGETGRKTWMVRYKANGRHRRMKIGTYPEMTLARARERTREIKAAAMAGDDPMAERRERRESAGDRTFESLVDEVLRVKARDTREATQTERRRIVDHDLLPRWKGREAGAITRRDVIKLVEAVADRAGAPMANRTLALVHLIFNEGVRREFPGIEYNPAHLVEKLDESRRRRYLDRKELGKVWTAIEAETPTTAGIFRVALLTAARIGSVCTMRWQDVGRDDVWTIPASEFKGKRRHCVPLSAEVQVVLEAMRPISGTSDYVFPGRQPGTPVSSHNSALRRIRKRTEIPRWTAHDFRRTFRTWATRPENPKHKSDPAGLGVAPHVADAVLGHKETSLGFDRYTAEPERYLISEKRVALEAWGAFVSAAVAEKGG